MQAVQYSAFGGSVSALKHVELPVPTPAKDEVLIKVEAASVNSIDWQIQEGRFRFLFPSKLPHTPGTDVAGEVVSLGPGVKTLAVGDKVSSWLSFKKGGSLAEYAIAPIKTTVKRPEEVSAIDGASLGVAGSTAIELVCDYIGIKLDGSNKTQKNLLITAASGGVGIYAVQLAKLGGAHVTVTCGARNIDLMKSLGADEVLDYKTPEGAQLQSPSGKKYDAVIQGAHYQPFSYFKPQLAPRAIVIDLTPSRKLILTTVLQRLTFSQQKFIPFVMSHTADYLNSLTNLIKDGKLKTIVDSIYPLSRAEDAWAHYIEGHATGKVLVTMVGE
jgi:NADPH:quinone reductase-like Zn-dependent oxidoreductase